MRAAKFIPLCEKIVFYGNADRDWKGRNMDKKHLYNVLVFLYYYLIAAYVAVYYSCASGGTKKGLIMFGNGNIRVSKKKRRKMKKLVTASSLWRQWHLPSQWKS